MQIPGQGASAGSFATSVFEYEFEKMEPLSASLPASAHDASHMMRVLAASAGNPRWPGYDQATSGPTPPQR